MGPNPALNPRWVVLLILLPVAINMFLIIMMKPARIKKRRDMLLHLIQNIWHILPLRLEDGKDQVHKNREHTLHLIKMGVIMTVTVGVTAWLMDGPKVFMPLVNVTLIRLPGPFSDQSKSQTSTVLCSYSPGALTIAHNLNASCQNPQQLKSTFSWEDSLPSFATFSAVFSLLCTTNTVTHGEG